MARRVMEIGLALVVTAALLAHASAQSSSCAPAIVSLIPCLGFITGNSSAPSASCCSQLATVVQTQARCLCTVLNGGAASIGLNINQTQALTLPGACKVQTPPLSQCNAAVPGPAIAPAVAPSAPSTPSTPSSVPSSPAPETPSTPSVPSSSSPDTPSTPSVPSSSSPDTPSTPSAPSDGGSKTVPSTSGVSSDGSSINRSRSMISVVFFLAACLSSLTNL